MANYKIQYGNVFDTATISGPAWNTSFPVTNLGHPDVAKAGRTTSAARSATWFRFKLTAVAALTFLALSNHNLSAAGTSRLRLGAASLDLDFTTGNETDSRITSSGATGGTRVNSSGLIVSGTTPRVDHNPVTLACLGVLIEQQSTNQLLHSADHSNAAYTKTNATIGANSSADPSGTTLADTITATANNGSSAQTFAAGGTTTQAYSLYVRESSTSAAITMTITWSTGGVTQTVSVLFNGTTGAITSSANSGATLLTASTTDAGNSYNRILLIGTGTNASNTNVTCTVSIATSGQTAVVWGGQCEQLPIITSYIPTTTTQATRTADVMAITGTNFSSATTGIGYNAAASTLYAEWRPRMDSAAVLFPPAVSISDNTSNNILYIYSRTSDDKANVAMFSGAALQVDIQGAVVTYGSVVRAAVSATANSVKYSSNAAAVQTDTVAVMPVSPTRLDIGAQPGSYSNGHIARVAYWPEALSSADVLTLSTSGPSALGYDSGFTNALQMTFNTATPSNWGQSNDVQRIFASQSYQYGILEINDTANTDGWIQIGRAFAGIYNFQPAVNPEQNDYADTHVDYSTIERNQSGRPFFNNRRKAKRASLSWPVLTLAEGRHLHEIQAYQGTTEDLYLIPDTADAAQSQRFGFLGAANQISPLRWPEAEIRAGAIELEQK